MDEDNGSASSEQAPSVSRFVKILVLVGIGIPVLIEAVTLVRLIGGHVGEDDGGATSADTAAAAYVYEGDELLPRTAAQETVARLTVEPAAEAWVFEMVLRVHNTTADPYTLRLGPVDTQNSQQVARTVTQTWAPGDSTRWTATWRLPLGALPTGLIARAQIAVSEDSTRTVQRAVRFGKIPVEWRRK